MEDILKIILEADVEQDSLDNIQQKLKKIKDSAGKIVFDIDFDGFDGDIEQFIKNFETLNGTMKDHNKNRIRELEKIRQEQRKNAEQTEKELKKQIESNNKIAESEENLRKKTIKKTEKGDFTKREYGVDHHKKVTSQLEGQVEQLDTIHINQAKVNEEYNKMSKLVEELGTNRRKLSADEKRFVDSFSSLDKNSEDYGQQVGEVSKQFDRVIEKQKVWLEIEKQKKALNEDIDRMTRRGIVPQDEINKLKEVSELFNKTDHLQQARRNPDFSYQEKFNADLEKTKGIQDELLETEKRLTLYQEEGLKIRKQITDLQSKGYQVGELNALKNSIQENTGYEKLKDSINKAKNELKEFTKLDSKIEQISKQAKNLGLNFAHSFKGLEGEEFVEKLNSSIATLYTKINSLKQKGIEVDSKELNLLEEQLQQLKLNSQQYKSQAQQQQSFQKRLDSLNKSTKTLGMNFANSFQDLEGEEYVQKLYSNIHTLQKQINNLKQNGNTLDELSVNRLEEQAQQLKLNADQYKKTAKYQESLSNRLDKLSDSARDFGTSTSLSFQGLEDDDFVQRTYSNIANFENRINSMKKDGNDLDEKEVKFLEDQLKQMKSNSQEYKTQAKFQQKLNNQLDSVAKSAKTLGLNFAHSMEGLEGEEYVNKLNNNLSILYKRINELKKEGRTVNEDEVRLLEEQAQQLKLNSQQYKKQLNQQQQMTQQINKINGDLVQGRENEPFTQQASTFFDGDNSILEQRENAKLLAKSYLEQRRGLNNLNEDLASVRRSFDKFNNEQLEVTYEVERANGVFRKYSVVLDQTTRSMYDLGDAGRQAKSIQTASLFKQLQIAFKRVPVWMTALGSLYGAINQVRQGFQSIYDIDEAMTNLSKVTDATQQEFEDFRLEAVHMGQELGALTEDVIDAVTEFQRLGYSLESAKELGETALIYANVGDMNVEDATGNLVSALKGFGVEQREVVEESERYVNIFNEVGNNYAISSAGIGEALKRSSAVLYEAGNDVEQATALITSANAVIQDPKKVGTAMKTISMRLRGVDEASGEALDTMPELRDMFDNVGVSIMENASTFKDTYTIFQDLAKVWDDISNIEQAELIEAIGGKRQGVVVSAVLNNFADATNSYETALDSAGSASREFAKYQESMVYRVDELKTSLQEFWVTAIDLDAIKSLVSSLNDLVNIMTTLIDKVGAVSLVGTATLPILFTLNENIRSVFFDTKKSTKTVLAELLGLNTGVNTLSGSLKGLLKIVSRVGLAMVAGFAIGAIIDALIKNINNLKNSNEEYLKQLDENIQKNQKLIDQLKNSNLDDYKELELKVNMNKASTEEIERYKNLQNDLTKMNDEFVSHYDAQGKAIAKTADELERLNDEKEREMLRDIRDRISENQAQWGSAGNYGIISDIFSDSEFESIEKQKQSISELNDVLLNRKAIIDSLRDGGDLNRLFSVGNIERVKENVNGIKQFREYFEEELQKMVDSGTISSTTKMYTLQPILDEIDDDDSAIEINSKMEQVFEKLAEGHENRVESLKDEIQDGNSELESIFDDMGLEQHVNDIFKELSLTMDLDTPDQMELLTKTKGLFEGFLTDTNVNVEEALNDVEGNVKSFIESVSDENIPIEEFLIEGGTIQVREWLEQMGEETENNAQLTKFYTEMLRGLKNELAGMPNQHALPSFENFQQDLALEIKNYREESQDLWSAVNALNEGNELDFDTINKLVGKHQELASAVYEENGVLKLQQKAVENVASTRRKTYNEEISRLQNLAKTEQEAVKAYIQGNIERIKSEEKFADARYDAYRTTIEQKARDLTEKELSGRNFRSGWDFKWAYDSAYENHLKELEAEANKRKADLSGYINYLESLRQTAGRNTVGTPNYDNARDETENLIYVSDELKERLREIDDLIREQQKTMDKYPSYSKEYQNALKNEADLIGQKVKAIKDEKKALEEQIRTGNIRRTGLIDTDEQESSGGGGGTSNTTYTVRRGDTLSEIGQKFGVNWRDIQSRNNISDPRGLQVGQQLVITVNTSGGGGGGNTGNNDAETQQAIDQAKDEVAQLEDQILNLQRDQREKYYEAILGEVERLEHDSDLVSDDIIQADMFADREIAGTDEWKEYREKRLGFLEEQHQNALDSIDYLEQEINNTSNGWTQQQKQALWDVMREQKKLAYDLEEQIYDTELEITEETMNDIVDSVEENLEEVSKIINEFEDELETFDNDKDIGRTVSIHENILDSYRDQLQMVRERREELMKEEDSVKDFPQLYEDWKEKVADLNDEEEDLTDNIRDTQNEIRDIQEGAVDDLIGLYKEYYEERQQLELDAIEETREQETKLHDERMKNYDEDLQAFTDNINEQIRMIDEAERERDYQRDLEQQQNERQEIIDLISLYQNDNSIDGRARLRELQGDLEEVTQNIADTQRSRQIELRKQALQDELKSRQEETEELKNAETDRYNEEMERLEEHQKEVERRWENLINNERHYADMRSQLMSGNIATITEEINSFVDVIERQSEKIGESLSQNLIDKFNEAKTGIEDIDSILSDSQYAFNSTYGLANKNNNLQNEVYRTIAVPDDSIFKTQNQDAIKKIIDGKEDMRQYKTVNVSMNVDKFTGDEESAKRFLDLISNGLTRKGVNM